MRGYDVIGKIRQTKASGTFDEIVAPPAATPAYRLAAAIEAGRRYAGSKSFTP